jgi:hypothetical protein
MAIEFYPSAFHQHSIGIKRGQQRMPAMQLLGTFNIECSNIKTFVSVHAPVTFSNHRITLLLNYTSNIPLDATYFNALNHAVLHTEV